MRLYIGVDFHPHRQTVCWMDLETGEVRTIELLHNRVEEVRAFYKAMPKSVVGIEASSQATWFEDLIFENGHELVVGDPALIRKRAVSRHKSDKRDAEHIFTLLVNGEFPALWRRPRESVHLLEVIRLRSSFVRQRTQVYNRLQAVAHEVGLRKGIMRTTRFQKVLKEADMNEVQGLRRSHLFRLMDSFSLQIGELDLWLGSHRRVRADQQGRFGNAEVSARPVGQYRRPPGPSAEKLLQTPGEEETESGSQNSRRQKTCSQTLDNAS